MTREKAIECNKNLRMYMELSDKNKPYKFLEDNYIVLDMAIKALEQKPCEDAISRQAVLDGIEELKKSPWATDKRGIGFEYLITEALEVVADLCVKQEPPVTPKPKTDVLDKIKAEIEQDAIKSVFGTKYIFVNRVNQIIDKYKVEKE